MQERDESCQKKLNQAEHRNLGRLSRHVHQNVLKTVASPVVSGLLLLYEATTHVGIFQ